MNRCGKCGEVARAMWDVAGGGSQMPAEDLCACSQALRQAGKPAPPARQALPARYETATDRLWGYGPNWLGLAVHSRRPPTAVRLMMDEEGSMAMDTCCCAPFEAVRAGGASDNARHFTGEQWKQTADLCYARARWYDPGAGMFASGDLRPAVTEWVVTC
jgi:RHS repeat-associated protein